MSSAFRLSRSLSGIVCLALSAVLAFACGESKTTVTGPGAMGTVAGTVVLGASSTGSARTEGTPIGLAGVTVRVSSGGASTSTDATGSFMLSGVPAGNTELAFERNDINARGRVVVAAGGMNTITVSIVGSRADIVPGGHSGLEIEGLVQAMAGGTLTVLDQRQGALVIHTDSNTVIRSGDTSIPLSQIQVGNRVHVKALTQSDGSILATEIVLQSDKVGGNREVEGTVTSVDQGARTFVVKDDDPNSAAVTVVTDSSTTFKKKGSSASFADVVMGAQVEVNGTLQGDGTVLAKKVTIEN